MCQHILKSIHCSFVKSMKSSWIINVGWVISNKMWMPEFKKWTQTKFRCYLFLSFSIRYNFQQKIRKTEILELINYLFVRERDVKNRVVACHNFKLQGLCLASIIQNSVSIFMKIESPTPLSNIENIIDCRISPTFTIEKHS